MLLPKLTQDFPGSRVTFMRVDRSVLLAKAPCYGKSFCIRFVVENYWLIGWQTHTFSREGFQQRPKFVRIISKGTGFKFFC
jgi:hypothetical protein